MAQQPWCPDDATSDEILAAYRAGVSARTLAKRFGVADVTIVGFLRRRGVETRNRSSAARKWAVNENAFDALTPEAIYWIGFLLADGNIYRHPKHSDQLNVGLMESDAGHVEKLKTFLGSNKPLYFRNGAVFLSVNSDTLCARLAEFGIVPRKSWVATAPEVCKNDSDFWRGVLDGDGWVTWARGGYPLTGLCGTQAVVSAFQEFVGHKTGLRHVSGCCCQAAYSCIIAAAIARRLYDNACVSLERKHHAAQQLMRWETICRSPRQTSLLVYKRLVG